MDSPESSELLQDTLIKLSHQTNFQPMQFLFSPHNAFSTLPSSLQKVDILEPAQVFELFFTSEIMDILVKHTNTYADIKNTNSGDKAWKLPGRIWKNVSKSELKRWIGILIYMGVFGSCATRDYWRKSTLYPTHPISEYMSQTRFEQILHYFHISDPSVVPENNRNTA